jgi:hypothetical protein
MESCTFLVAFTVAATSVQRNSTQTVLNITYSVYSENKVRTFSDSTSVVLRNIFKILENKTRLNVNADPCNFMTESQHIQ